MDSRRTWSLLPHPRDGGLPHPPYTCFSESVRDHTATWSGQVGGQGLGLTSISWLLCRGGRQGGMNNGKLVCTSLREDDE